MLCFTWSDGCRKDHYIQVLDRRRNARFGQAIYGWKWRAFKARIRFCSLPHRVLPPIRSNLRELNRIPASWLLCLNKGRETRLQRRAYSEVDQGDGPRWLHPCQRRTTIRWQQTQAIMCYRPHWEPSDRPARRAKHGSRSSGQTIHVDNHFKYIDITKVKHSRADDSLHGGGRSSMHEDGHHGRWVIQVFWLQPAH